MYNTVGVVTRLHMHSAKGQSTELYHAQQRDLHDSLLVKGRLVFYNLHCNMVVCFSIPAFCNLSEGTLAKHVLDNIPNYHNVKINLVFINDSLTIPSPDLSPM